MKYTIQETESINSKTGAREKIYVVGIEGEKTDANGFWEFDTREKAEAKIRELESKCRYCGADAYYLEEPLAYLAIYRVDKGERIVDLCLDCASIIENKLKITD